MSIHSRTLLLSGLLLATACSDAGTPLVPGPKAVTRAVLNCALNVSTASLQCVPTQADAGGVSASGQIITGGQNTYVTLTSSNFASTATSLEFDVTVQNLMRQPLGTTDGVTLHSNGVRVWFMEEPTAQPTGTVSVDSMSGVEILFASPTPYFQYNEVLYTNDTSAPKRWRFDFSGGATNIYFQVYVVAQVQYENGWAEVTPASDTLAPLDTLDLDAFAYGVRADAGPPVSQTFTWSSSDNGVAAVNSSTGMVTAISDGTTTITATNGTQSGSAIIVVSTP